MHSNVDVYKRELHDWNNEYKESEWEFDNSPQINLNAIFIELQKKLLKIFFQIYFIKCDLSVNKDKLKGEIKN